MRLQILELPTRHLGDVMEAPFVLVVSEMKNLSGQHGFTADFRSEIGAAGIYVTNETVEIGPA